MVSDALNHLRGVHASLYAVRGVLQEAIDEIETLLLRWLESGVFENTDLGQKSREFIERASASTLTKPYQSAEYWRETAEKALAEGAALEAALREEMERAQYRPEDIDEHIAGIKHSASTRRDIGQEILDGLKDLKRSQNKD